MLIEEGGTDLGASRTNADERERRHSYCTWKVTAMPGAKFKGVGTPGDVTVTVALLPSPGRKERKSTTRAK